MLIWSVSCDANDRFSCGTQLDDGPLQEHEIGHVLQPVLRALAYVHC